LGFLKGKRIPPVRGKPVPIIKSANRRIDDPRIFNHIPICLVGMERAIQSGRSTPKGSRYMKTSLKLILAILMLVPGGLCQEPKKALNKETPTGDAKVQVVNGAPKLAAPSVQPKALPPLNPPLGDIARQARAARAAAPKAEVVVETDTAQQK
jgi:hypothetical protein